MMAQRRDLGIEYQGALSGLFEVGVVPLDPGTYPYMPLRSLTHLRMCDAIKAGEWPRCRFQLGREWVSFEVVAIPEPHWLTLDRFQQDAPGL